MSSETLHEDPEKLGPEVIDHHRAIASLMEELEAVDWYNQRAKATKNPELRAILEHNRDEEKEHAAMALEWIRRNDPKMRCRRCAKSPSGNVRPHSSSKTKMTMQFRLMLCSKKVPSRWSSFVRLSGASSARSK